MDEKTKQHFQEEIQKQLKETNNKELYAWIPIINEDYIFTEDTLKNINQLKALGFNEKNINKLLNEGFDYSERYVILKVF